MGSLLRETRPTGLDFSDVTARSKYENEALIDLQSKVLPKSFGNEVRTCSHTDQWKSDEFSGVNLGYKKTNPPKAEEEEE